MSGKYDSITLGFENCEGITILAKYINALFISGVTDSLMQINEDNELRSHKSAESVSIHFNLEANTKFIPDKNFGYENTKELFRRLSYHKDLVSITINYSFNGELDKKSNESVEYYVYWSKDSDEYTNPAQFTEYGKDAFIVRIQNES